MKVYVFPAGGMHSDTGNPLALGIYEATGRKAMVVLNEDGTGSWAFADICSLGIHEHPLKGRALRFLKAWETSDTYVPWWNPRRWWLEWQIRPFWWDTEEA